MDSFDSDSPTYQTKSWECPPSVRKRLIPDSSTIYNRRASLRSANKCSAVVLGSLPKQVVYPSTLAQEIRHEKEIEKVGDYFAPKNCSVDVAQIDIYSIQMEEHNSAFEAECIPQPLAKYIQVQASSNSRPMERVDTRKGKSISIARHASSLFSLNLTEMVSMLNNEGDEVNSIGQSSRMDTVEVEGYQVRLELESIARKILTKHRDIFKNSSVSTMVFRSILLEMICDIISELQHKNLHDIAEDELQSMIGLANEIKDMKVNIEWLNLRLEEILEARQILNQFGILKEKKYISKKIIETVKRELEQCEAEKKALETKKSACKESLARAQDESAKISQTITHVKSKVKPFVNCSLVDGLL